MTDTLTHTAPSAAAFDLSGLDDLKLIDTEIGLHSIWQTRKSADHATDDVEAAHACIAEEMRKRSLLYEPLAKGKPTPPMAADAEDPEDPENPADEGDDATSPTTATKKDVGPHAFVPVRNICRHCKGPAEDHVAKAIGKDGSLFMAKADYSVDERKQQAERGQALPDGSFPILNEADLHNAIRLVGQASDPQAAMNHIIERATAMGMEDALPDAWQPQSPDAGTPQVGPGAHAMGAATPGKPAGMAGPAAKPPVPAQKPNPGTAAAPVAPKPPTPGMVKRVSAAVAKALGFSDEDVDEVVVLDDGFEYAVIKSTNEERFTLGPVYMPKTLDAHDEWATAEDLQKSTWDYVRETGDDRTVYLQHSPKPAGEWVEIVSWPHEVRTVMQKSVNGVTKATETTFPAGTVYMGVVWEPWAYEDVKKGKITGFSMGGFSRRVEADIE